MEAWLAELSAHGDSRPFPPPPPGLAPHVLVVVPHPDDFDIVGCTLRDLSHSGATVALPPPQAQRGGEGPSR